MSVSSSLWSKCLEKLEGELSAQQLNTWIRPLQPVELDQQLKLLAPNRFVLDWVKNNFIKNIEAILPQCGAENYTISIEIGSAKPTANKTDKPNSRNAAQTTQRQPEATSPQVKKSKPSNTSNLNPEFVFDAYVEGKSNQLARAAGLQVAENPGGAYNPLFLYGGVGLGKTHLIHAIGNMMQAHDPNAKVVYLRSERFVGDMVKALQHNTINEFKRHYRSMNALLIDDIQFFAGKERSQEEFFHTFNALLEQNQQIIMTCDRYPKEVSGLEDRLKSRFGWGLTVAIEPPDLETRVAIIMSKANTFKIDLPDEVAFFIAKRLRSNVRELEGALRRVYANSQFTGKAITLDFAKDALQDLLAVQDRLVTIENIMKTIAEYFKIRVSDLTSKSRSRSIARPRQVAMALSKELTNHSLPEIGDAFGGRDHTTVLHACRKIKELQETDVRIREDMANLIRVLTS